MVGSNHKLMHLPPIAGYQETAFRKPCKVMWDMPKPAIASINGAAAGLGFGMA